MSFGVLANVLLSVPRSATWTLLFSSVEFALQERMIWAAPTPVEVLTDYLSVVMFSAGLEY
ncbi:hypothetical protein Tdes44962_MAKER06470 [Teratosphaeria destructans]|uniref:Uncharacterized protein n=1 Tax=Teratosphaeria destructans TaxID=418781 RepID=A0A9W7T242_9PEZI|nr:hypothetical protein Tdes44962_MAKER06470 [Teratosphaeria destructans]